MRRDDLSNEEVIAAFTDWCSQFRVGTFNGKPLFTDEKMEAKIAAVRQFAEFIEPKLLAESTIADMNAFRRRIPTGARQSFAGIEAFRAFRASILKAKRQDSHVT